MRGDGKSAQFQHYRASRHFAQMVLSQRDYDSQLAGLLLEFHACTELCTAMQLLPSHEDIEAACNSPVLQLRNLHLYKSFGVLFGGASELYELSPLICQLAERRSSERATGKDLGCDEIFESLRTKIGQWSYQYTAIPAGNTVTHSDIASGAIVQHAVLLFLYAANHQNPKVLREMSEPLVDSSIELMGSMKRTGWFASFWPVIVIGSFATTNAHQSEIRRFLPPVIPITEGPLQLLDWVWETPDDVIGLDGIRRGIQRFLSCDTL
jgi:hypothetical protein